MKTPVILLIGFVFGVVSVFGFQTIQEWEPVPFGGIYIDSEIVSEKCSTFMANSIIQTRRDDSGMVYLMLRNLSCYDSGSEFYKKNIEMFSH